MELSLHSQGATSHSFKCFMDSFLELQEELCLVGALLLVDQLNVWVSSWKSYELGFHVCDLEMVEHYFGGI